MKSREQLNQAHYQRAANFAAHLDAADRAEYLTELAERQAFEQAHQPPVDVQKSGTNYPLVALLCGLLMVIGGSGLFYWQTERYQTVQTGMAEFHQFQQQTREEDSRQRNEHYIVNLQNQLRQDPNNGDRWFELGQAYSLNNDFESALISFRNAQTVLGDNPAIFGAMATADYYQHKQQLTEQAKAWIEQALAKDPYESSSLLILASEAFLHNNYAEALQHWQKVLDGQNQAIDRRAIIQSMQLAEQMQKASK